MRKSKTDLLKIDQFRGSETTNCLVGQILSIDEEGKAIVDYPDSPTGPIQARFALAQPLTEKDIIGRRIPVLLLFENGDPTLPIIVGIVRDSFNRSHETENITIEMEKTKDVLFDGKKITFEAMEQIELRCGKSSVLLTREGRIVLKGTEVVSRASRTNKIKGSSVRIN